MTDGRYPKLKFIAPVIPYLAIGVGLTWFQHGWASILLYHFGIVCTLALANYWHFGEGLKRKQDLWALIGVVLISTVAGAVIYGLWPTLAQEQLELDDELADLGLSQTAWIIFIFYYFTVNPILEELFWRGYLGSTTKYLAWSEIWYAGYHVLILVIFIKIPWIIASLVVLVAAGWIWRQLARYYRGLLFPILSHAAADASIIWAAFFFGKLMAGPSPNQD